MHAPSFPALQIFHDILHVSPCTLALPQQSYLMILEIQQKLNRILLEYEWENKERDHPPQISLQYLWYLDKLLRFSIADQYRCLYL